MRIVLISITALLLICGSSTIAGELHEAAEYGDVNKVKALLAKGADVNAKDEGGKTALHRAIWVCQDFPCVDMLQLLVNNGADVNARDRNGWTPLDHCLDRISAGLEWEADDSEIERFISAGAHLMRSGAVLKDVSKAQMKELHDMGGSWEAVMRAAVKEMNQQEVTEYEDKVGPTHIKISGFLLHSERTDR